MKNTRTLRAQKIVYMSIMTISDKIDLSNLVLFTYVYFIYIKMGSIRDTLCGVFTFITCIGRIT